MLLNRKQSTTFQSTSFIFWLCLQIILGKRTYSASSPCSYFLTRNSGTFTSPKYPEKPETKLNFLYCQWEIKVETGKEILMRIGDLDIEGPNDDCQQGNVVFYEGIGKSREKMDSYCPGDSYNDVMIQNNSATVIFHWPRNFKGRGFLISYIAITPGEAVHDFVACSKTGEQKPNVNMYSVVCAGGCGGIETHNVWGGGCYGDACIGSRTRAYRDNSYLCKAAVHAGVISDLEGGKVRVRLVSGFELYFRAKANGIMTKTGALSEWAFEFPDSERCKKSIPIEKNDFTASSYWNDSINDPTKWQPYRAWFDKQSFSWSPDNPTVEQWLQVSLPDLFKITAIETKGNKHPVHWIEYYWIKYSLNGKHWQDYIPNGSDEPKLFIGNFDSFAAVVNNFVSPAIIARYIRIYPKPTTSRKLRYAFSVQFSGCRVSKDGIPLLPTTTTDATVLLTPSKKSHKTKQDLDLSAKNTSFDSDINNKVTITQDSNDNNSISGTNVIVIVITFSVFIFLLAITVLFLVRNHICALYRNKNGSPANSSSQSNYMYSTNAGMPVRFMPQSEHSCNKLLTTSGPPTMSSTASGNNGARIEYQNKHYRDANMIQNSRGLVSMMYNTHHHESSGTTCIAGSIPMHHSIPQKVNNSEQSQMLRQESDSFESDAVFDDEDDDDDHEYQVIPDYDLPTTAQIQMNSSSKASTGSSFGHPSRTGEWSQHPPQIIHTSAGIGVWNQDSNFSPTFPLDHSTNAMPPLPPTPQTYNHHMQPSMSRGQHCSTFPHNNTIEVSSQVPIPSGQKHSFESFTAPRPTNVHQQKRHKPNRPPHGLMVTSLTKPFHHPATRSPSSASTVLMESPLPHESSHAVMTEENMAYYSAVANEKSEPQLNCFYESDPQALLRHGSYNVPTNLPLQSFGVNEVRPSFHHQNYPPETQLNQRQPSHHSSLGREVQTADVTELAGYGPSRPLRTESKQRNGYDHLSRDQFRNNLRVTETPSSIESNERCIPSTPQINTYHQLDLNSRV